MMEVFLRADGFERLLGFLEGRVKGLDRTRLAAELRASLPEYDVDGLASSIPNLVPSRAANRLNLHGAAFTVDAACASSLVAVETAVGRLREGKCGVAVAAGVNFTHVPAFWYLFTRILAISPTERVRPFDRRADGMLIGEGAGAVVLKRLEDAEAAGDQVYAVVRGTGSSSDGRSVGVLAPSSAGQIRALERAYADARCDPGEISFLEAHGTGTQAGDLAEIETIAKFYGKPRGEHGTRVMGSVKSMIGHAMPAAGIASFIKAALALSNKILPPSLHCEQPHPLLAETAFHVGGETRPWIHPPSHPRRAGINSFGFGGINAHVVLEEARPPLKTRLLHSGVPRPGELLAFSGAGAPELAARLRRAGRAAAPGVRLEDLAFTLAGEAEAKAPCRLAFVASASEDVGARLEALAAQVESGGLATREPELLFYEEGRGRDGGRVAAVFPGLAFPGLVGEFPRHLLLNCIHFPRVREIFDLVEARDGNPDDPVPTSFLLVPPAHLAAEERARLQSRFAPPPMMTQEDAEKGRVPPGERNLSHMGMLANNWASWLLLRDFGVPVDMLCGQSLGDVSAILAAGMADFEENMPQFWKAFDIQLNYGDTGMIAMVGAGEEAVQPHLERHPEVSIGLHLSPTTMVIGGPEPELREVAKELREKGILAQTLPFPPIHTPQLKEVQDEFTRALGEMASLKPAQITVYSAVLAAPMSRDPEEVEKVLRTNVSRPIRFWQTLRRMVDDGARFIVQIGSGTLAANSRSVLGETDAVCVAMDVSHRDPLTQIQAMAGQLFAHGLGFDLGGLFTARAPSRLDLDAPQAAPAPRRAAVELTLYWPPMHAVQGEVKKEEAPGSAEAKGEARGRLPFLGRVLRHEAGREVEVEAVLTLAEHRYLADHLFVNARPEKPVEACLPVMPMTMALEMLAETAACLAPGLGLVGFERVRALRWIGFEDSDRLVVRLAAKVARQEAGQVVVEVAASVGDQTVTRAEAVFAPRYRETLRLQFPAVEDPAPLPVRARELYEEGFLFHGPAFQCLTGLGERGRRSIDGELSVLDRSRLFSFDSAPQLLTDPVVLDGAGQLLGTYFYGVDGYVLPVSVDRIEFYRPSPEPGARCPARVVFREIDFDARRTKADVEIQDGSGGVWLRVEGWQDIVFRWGGPMLRNLRQPRRCPLAGPRELEGLPGDGVATLLESDVLREMQPDWLARMWLHQEEWKQWLDAGSDPRSRKQWLVGRIAAKDAVRLWLARRTGGEELIHPVLIVLDNEASGRLVVRSIGGADLRPSVSLSHVEKGAAAAACGPPVGIDLESSNAAGGLEIEAFTTEAERARLAEARLDAVADAGWRTRVWCAKESAGKLRGEGLQGRPRDLEIIEAEADGQMRLIHRPSGRAIDVHATAVGDFIVAIATFTPASGGAEGR
jgi:acyl transferase domain-containing protein